MGGHGSGGAPSGSRKPAEQVFEGPLPEVDPPAWLSPDELAHWNGLADYARSRRTLVPETAERFGRLCRSLVLEQTMREMLAKDGLTETVVSLQMDEKGGGLQSVHKKAHALLGKLLELAAKNDLGLVAFRLAPTGRPVQTESEKPKSALETLQAQRPGQIRQIRSA